MLSNAEEQLRTISDTVPDRSPPGGQSKGADTAPLLCTRLARPDPHRPLLDLTAD